VYAGTGNGVYKSVNGGVSWVPSNSGIEKILVRALAIDPATPTTIYGGTDTYGVFRSSDGGATWQPTGSQ
jgi:hypothetical protein